jgi:hypothetical protein
LPYAVATSTPARQPSPGDEYDNTQGGTEGYIATLKRALANGWNRETVDSHIVGGNTVCHCEQASIIGSLGAAFSKIFGNVILPYHGLDPQLLEQMLVHPAHVTRQAFTENGHELARTDLEGTPRDQNGVFTEPWNKTNGGALQTMRS